MRKINVTKTFLPPLEEYEAYLKQIWQRDWLTNQGPLLQQLESELKDQLRVANLHFVSNGTVALQIALRILDVDQGEVITTPFSYVATTSSILWEGCRPVFVDIDPETFCLDSSKIEAAITPQTKAIMPVHVFGNPCDIKTIDSIADKYNLKVIYDGAHAFGVELSSRSLLNQGDISICSFHATKPFHTIEGGCLVVKDKSVSDRIGLAKRFGHNGDDHYMLGINAKATEFQAAMGLCNLKHISEITEGRKKVSKLYDKLLSNKFQRQKITRGTSYNYSYYPILLDDEEQVLDVVARLNKRNIFPRRYFYPSLNRLPYIKSSRSCPVSEGIASRILCLPLYNDLEEDIVQEICEEINQ